MMTGTDIPDRKAVQKGRGAYLTVYIDMCIEKGMLRPDMAREIVEQAVESGYLEEPRELMANTLISWSERRNPPAWATKAAMDLVVTEGVFPNANVPMQLAVFSNIWFDTRGPFESLEDAIKSLPKDQEFPIESVTPHLEQEVRHYLEFLERRAQRDKK